LRTAPNLGSPPSRIETTNSWPQVKMGSVRASIGEGRNIREDHRCNSGLLIKSERSYNFLTAIDPFAEVKSKGGRPVIWEGKKRK